MNIEVTDKSRLDLLQWLNDLLKANVPRIEQLGTGAVYCQLFDYIYPGKVQLTKVNWKAKNEYEYVQNFKFLQVAFTKQNISKPIEVYHLHKIIDRQIEKLIKCKYQDNLEFLQWFKKHFDQNGIPIKDYDPQLKRNGQELEYNQIEQGSNMSNIFVRQNSKNRAPTKVIQGGICQLSKNSSTSNLSFNKENDYLNVIDRKQNCSFKNNMDLLAQIEAIKQERDYYFNKLRDIDNVASCFKEQNIEKLVFNLKEILYCASDKTISITDDGNVETQGEQS